MLWKLTEPLAALALNATLLGKRVNPYSAAAVLVVLAGVVLFSATAATSLSFVPIVSANVIFPLRNALLKLCDSDAGAAGETQTQRFAHLAVFSLPVVVVATALTPFAAISGNEEPLAEVAPVLLQVRNAALFNMYQFASISLLALVDTVSHSLLNTFKRVSGVVFVMFALHKAFEPQHIFGLFVLFSGFCLYVVYEGKINVSAIKALQPPLQRAAPILIPVLVLSPLLYSWYFDVPVASRVAELAERDPLLGQYAAGYMVAADRSDPYVDRNASFCHLLVDVRDVATLDGEPGRDSRAWAGYSDDGDVTNPPLWRVALAQRIARFPSASSSGNCFRHCRDGSTTQCLQLIAKLSKKKPVVVHVTAGALNVSDEHALLRAVATYMSSPRVERVVLFQRLLLDSAGPNDELPSTETLKLSGDSGGVSDELAAKWPQLRSKPLTVFCGSRQTCAILARLGLPVDAGAGAGAHGQGGGLVCPTWFASSDGRVGRTVASRLATLRTLHMRAHVGVLAAGSTPGAATGLGSDALLRSISATWPRLRFVARGDAHGNRLARLGLLREGDAQQAGAGYMLVDALRRVDVAVCARADDALAAMAAGRPGVVVSDDRAQRDLAASCGAPVVAGSVLGDGETARTLVELLHSVDVDGDELDRTRCVGSRMARAMYGAVGLDVTVVVRATSVGCVAREKYG